MPSLLNVFNEVKKTMYGDKYDTSSSNKFNFAIIKKEETNITYEELWILSNAYYDYTHKRFVKIDPTHATFGIQIQANGSYPGEAELGYMDNVGINIWRNPIKEDAFKDSSSFDYSDWDNNNYIGAKRLSDNSWQEFGISTGWNNSFMVDSYGGMTIGGAGFEVDGNGIYPYTRLTSSAYTDENNNTYYLLGLLDNAYHPTTGGWDCDSNEFYSWFIGIKFPHKLGSYLKKDSENAKFVVMYNDNNNADLTDTHNIDVSDWHVVFETDISTTKGLVDGTLTEFAAKNHSHASLESRLSSLENDSGWLDLNLTGNFYLFNNDNPVQYRKVGKTVQVKGMIVCNGTLTAGSEWNIATLPNGFRPSKNSSFICELSNNENLWTCTIKTNGDITFNRLRDTTGFIDGTVFVDTLKLDVTFLI